jgi:hypothetical protein
MTRPAFGQNMNGWAKEQWDELMAAFESLTPVKVTLMPIMSGFNRELLICLADGLNGLGHVCTIDVSTGAIECNLISTAIWVNDDSFFVNAYGFNGSVNTSDPDFLNKVSEILDRLGSMTPCDRSAD